MLPLKAGKINHSDSYLASTKFGDGNKMQKAADEFFKKRGIVAISFNKKDNEQAKAARLAAAERAKQFR